MDDYDRRRDQEIARGRPGRADVVAASLILVDQIAIFVVIADDDAQQQLGIATGDPRGAGTARLVHATHALHLSFRSGLIFSTRSPCPPLRLGTEARRLQPSLATAVLRAVSSES